MDSVSLTSKALSRFGEAKKIRPGDGLSSVAEELPKKEYKDNKEKRTAINLQSQHIINKLEPVNIMDYYLEKVNIDETESEAENGIYKKRRDNILRLMRENRPLYDKLGSLTRFLMEALVEHEDLEQINERSAGKQFSIETL